MAKPTFSVSGLTIEQAVAVNNMLGGVSAVGVAPAAPAPVAPAPAAPVAVPAAVPLATPTAVMPPVAAMPSAPPPPAAAPPPPAAAPAPPASGGNADIASAMTTFVKTNGAAAAVAIVKQATSAWPDGDPKKGSSKYQDIPEQYNEWVIGRLTGAIAG